MRSLYFMGMRRPRYNLGRVDWIGTESVGLPGQRTFRVMFAAGETTAQLWLEKEQLNALAEGIARILLEIDADKGLDLTRGTSGAENPKPPSFPEQPNIDFRVDSLVLRYDSSRDMIALEATDREAEADDPPMFRCLASRSQM